MSEKWTLKKHVAFLSQRFPLSKPVLIRRNHLLDEGSIAETDKAFYITINKDLDLRAQKDVLWHEYAHAMAGWKVQAHTNRWGICYARICRAIYDED